jgi:hypothetical protein
MIMALGARDPRRPHAALPRADGQARGAVLAGLVVGPVSQFGLCVVDVGELSFAEVVREARRRALNANKYAYYDMAGLADLLAGIPEERGAVVDLSV